LIKRHPIGVVSKFIKLFRNTISHHFWNIDSRRSKILDVKDHLQPGIPVCPPEGDTETGMIATNTVFVKTGSITAGTSVYGMIVLKKELTKAYPEIDLVTTNDGN
jgi:hypothetical protein